MNDLLDGLPWRVAERLVRVGRRARRELRGRRSLAEEWRALDRGAPGWKVEALRLALRGGGYETAARLAEEVAGDPRARHLVAEALHAVGQRERAAALEPAPLDPAALAREARGRPWRLLARPQLHLAGEPPALHRFLRAHGLPACRIAGASGSFLADLRFEAPRAVEGGPLVSVIMAARDAAGTIGYAIDSLLAQSWCNLEVLVCDDASADGTLALLRDRYGREPRVRVFASSASQGPYNLRNALLDEARGELVTFHDADDLALPTRIETQVRRLERGALVSFTTMVRVTAEGRFLFFRGGAAERPAMPSLMTARSRIGRFRPARFGADLDKREQLRAELGERAIDVLRQPLTFFLVSEQSLTRRQGSESLEDGYRSPARRAYSEAVFRRYVTGEGSDAEIERVLRETGNWAEPAGITWIAGAPASPSP